MPVARKGSGAPAACQDPAVDEVRGAWGPAARESTRPPAARAAVLLLVLAAALLARTWMTWANPFVDGSKELRIPERVARGERLYADVVCHYGPVPNWLHAGAYRLLGYRLATPLALLLPLTGLVFLSLFVLARRAAGVEAAAWGAAWGMTLALVAPNGGALVLPYSYPGTHALAFAALGLLLSLSPRRGLLAAAAACWAVALAGKQEFAVASMGASLLAHALGRPFPRLVPLRVALAVAGGFLGGIGLFAWSVRGLSPAALAPDGPFILFGLPAEWRTLFRLVSGLDDPSGSIRSVATAAFLVLVVLALVEGVGRLEERLRGAPRRALLLRGAVAAGLLLAVAALLGTPPGRELDKALPPLLAVVPLAASIAAVLAVFRGKDASPAGRARVALLGFAGLASFRVFLHVTYGWVATPFTAFAAPALTACAAVTAFHYLARRRVYVAIAFAGLVALQAGRTFLQSDPGRFAQVPTPAGTLRLPVDRAAAVRDALAFLSCEARPGDGLTGFPEAGLFNFALGMPNPMKLEQYLPGSLDPAGEALFARKLRDAGPRFVLIPNQPTTLFGAVAFGRDYARSVQEAIDERYRLRVEFGSASPGEPVGSPRFFLRVYERTP